MWYPQNKEELKKSLSSYLKENLKEKRKAPEKIHGLIVPHAGYEFSGEIAGKAYSILKNKKFSCAIILSPSHYIFLNGAVTHNQNIWETPLGKIKIMKTKFSFPELNIKQEHAIDNQIPFLQYLGFKEILPILVGNITQEKAKQIAKTLVELQEKNKDCIFIVSTDLSHFLPYEEAVKKDRQTIKIIETLDEKRLDEHSACGIFPLLILFEICKIKKYKPKLVEYKNSGDITGDKSGVVGYARFWF